MLRVGLTGGIASGKSLVGGLLKQHGARVIDADSITHCLYRQGQPGYERIVDAFGMDVVLPDGSIDRRHLGDIVFSDPEKLQMLNSIVHPVIMRHISDELTQCAARCPEGVAVVELPLLIEAGFFDLFDVVVLVYASGNIQKKRLVNRNKMSGEEAQKRLDSQMPIDRKRAYADYIIENTGDVAAARRQVSELYEILIQKAGAGGNTAR